MDISDAMDFDYSETMCCPVCQSERLIKNGTRARKGVRQQQLMCKSCRKFFLESYLYEGANPRLADQDIIDVYFKCHCSYNATASKLGISRYKVRKTALNFGIDPYQVGIKGNEVEVEWGSGVKTKYANIWELDPGDAYYYFQR